MIQPILRFVMSPVARGMLNAGVLSRFRPSALFRAGEQGVWYDPSDTTTLFQDSAGTTPVTASGQPVGLMLDKSGRGNHATQPTAGSRPIYRRGDSRGVVNLLLRSSEFDNAVWVKINSSISPNVVEAPDGSITAAKLVPSSGAALNTTSTAISEHGLASNSYCFSVYAKAAGLDRVRVRIMDAVTYAITHVVVSLVDGSYATAPGTTGTYTNATGAVEKMANGWFRLSIYGVPNSSNTLVAQILPYSSTLNSGDGTSGIYIWGAQLNLGPTALPYQRNDGNLGGVATGASTDLHWLETDGVDDGMVTGNIDFTGTDKVAIFAGVRKLSDAASATVAELSATVASTNGAFQFAAPSTSAAASYGMRSRGSALALADVTNATYAAPHSSILTGLADISGDSAILRVNGTQAATSSADQGTGNYGNHPLYLFRRGGTTLPFNGWFYGLAITGRLTTDAETAATERLLATKSGVTL